MDNRIPTPASSFIPKQGLTRDKRPAPRPVGLLMVVSLVLLFISLSFLGITYFYRSYLNDLINRPCEEISSGGGARFRRCGLVATVELEEKNLDRATTVLLQRLDRKLRLARELLAKHADIIPVYRMLEELTLVTVRYTRFSLTDRGLSIDGKASSYEDIAVQSQVFDREKSRIQSFIFSDLDLDNRGDVVFKLTLVPVANLTSYSQNFNQP